MYYTYSDVNCYNDRPFKNTQQQCLDGSSSNFPISITSGKFCLAWLCSRASFANVMAVIGPAPLLRHNEGRGWVKGKGE